MTDIAVPLICDPAPGGLLVIECEAALSNVQAARLCLIAREAVSKGLPLVLPKGFRARRIVAGQWPDAEYCAA
jgi:hypothetical protein